MFTCPICQFENSDATAVCLRCGRRPSESSDLPSAITVVDRAKSLSQGGSLGDSPFAASTPPLGHVTLVDETPPPAVPKGDNLESPTPAATPAPRPRLVVVRGEQLSVEYMVLEGKNYIGRSAEKAVDIDLDGQEAMERTWTSRQHALITLEQGSIVLEDLNSLNGTFVNRERVHPGQQRLLRAGDIVQIGTVQMRVDV